MDERDCPHMTTKIARGHVLLVSTNARTHWHRQLWISAPECKQTTETMTQDDNAEVKIVLNNCCLNTAFTMMRFISCEPCSSVQIIIVQCTRQAQSWHTCFFLRTCFFFYVTANASQRVLSTANKKTSNFATFATTERTVSYTHLTLPTICSV